MLGGLRKVQTQVEPGEIGQMWGGGQGGGAACADVVLPQVERGKPCKARLPVGKGPRSGIADAIFLQT